VALASAGRSSCCGWLCLVSPLTSQMNPWKTEEGLSCLLFAAGTYSSSWQACQEHAATSVAATKDVGQSLTLGGFSWILIRYRIKGTPPLSEGGVRAATAGTPATPMSSSGPSTGQQSMVDKINGRAAEERSQWPMLVIPYRMGQGPLVRPHALRPARSR